MKKFVLKKTSGTSSSTYRIDYASALNEAQLAAVHHTHGSALVIAGAGTGKTRTIIYRVARLIEDGSPPEHILMLTFTRKAAQEMLHRASSLLDERCHRVRGGTFHMYCSQILHRYAPKLGYPTNFSIIDADDSMDILHLLRSEGGFHKSESRFPQKSSLYAIYSAHVNTSKPIDDIIERDFPQFRGHKQGIAELYKLYSNYKKQHFIMDFDDLLLYTRDLLKQDEHVRLSIASENRFVLVDEYQDTNAIQAELIALFSDVHKNVMAVGDDAQSIYSFRGADHKNIMRFPQQFNCHTVIKLEENYRSTPQVLDVANTLLSTSTLKYEKTLRAVRDNGDLPALVKAGNEFDQSQFVAQMILQLREQDIALEDVAVLFRNGRDSYDLEAELRRLNLPFVKYGGQKFTEAAHIKDILAVVRALVNPMDALAWNRVLLLLEGIGPKTAKEFIQWLQTAQQPYELGAAHHLISEKYKSEILRLATLMVDIKNKNFSTYEAIKAISEWYEPICKRIHEDYPKRLKDIESFVGLSANYSSLSALMEQLALEPIEASAFETDGAKREEAPLVLSTIHSAKGLEWKHVFIIQCLDGIIPSGYSLENPEQLEEELRLMYVTVTRAQDMLYITYPVVHYAAYGDYFTNPSRFLTPMNEHVLEPWILVDEATQANTLPPSNKPPLLM